MRYKGIILVILLTCVHVGALILYYNNSLFRISINNACLLFISKTCLSLYRCQEIQQQTFLSRLSINKPSGLDISKRFLPLYCCQGNTFFPLTETSLFRMSINNESCLEMSKWFVSLLSRKTVDKWLNTEQMT